MNQSNRFQDKNLVRSDFYKEMWMVCPSCSKKAIAIVNFETKAGRLSCINCGYNKETTPPHHHYFETELWLQAPYKNDVFYAFNIEHLEYLERYIAATLREHKDRTHFTLLEKLPKFYHEAKNREGLLKIISKLKNKI
jgi:hypothetical protein